MNLFESDRVRRRFRWPLSGRPLVGMMLALAAWCGPSGSANGMPERFFAPYVDATLYPAFDIAGTAQTASALGRNASTSPVFPNTTSG